MQGGLSTGPSATLASALSLLLIPWGGRGGLGGGVAGRRDKEDRDSRAKAGLMLTNFLLAGRKGKKKKETEKRGKGKLGMEMERVALFVQRRWRRRWRQLSD